MNMPISFLYFSCNYTSSLFLLVLVCSSEGRETLVKPAWSFFGEARSSQSNQREGGEPSGKPHHRKMQGEEAAGGSRRFIGRERCWSKQADEGQDYVCNTLFISPASGDGNLPSLLAKSANSPRIPNGACFISFSASKCRLRGTRHPTWKVSDAESKC